MGTLAGILNGAGVGWKRDLGFGEQKTRFITEAGREIVLHDYGNE